MQEQLKINLVDFRSSITHTMVFAQILPEGELSVDGFDSGSLPVSDIWDDDVEYAISVPSEVKGKLRAILIEVLQAEERTFVNDPDISADENLLHLLAFVYQGRLSTFDEFKSLVEKKEIKHSFWWG